MLGCRRLPRARLSPVPAAVAKGATVHPHEIDLTLVTVRQPQPPLARSLALLERVKVSSPETGQDLDVHIYSSDDAVLADAAAGDDMAGKTIVTMLPDFAERYQTTALFDGLDV